MIKDSYTIQVFCPCSINWELSIKTPLYLITHIFCYTRHQLVRRLYKNRFTFETSKQLEAPALLKPASCTTSLSFSVSVQPDGNIQSSDHTGQSLCSCCHHVAEKAMYRWKMITYFIKQKMKRGRDSKTLCSNAELLDQLSSGGCKYQS